MGTETGKAIVWDRDVPLVTDRVTVIAVLKMCGLSGLIMYLLLGFIFATQGEWDLLLPMAGICAAVVGGMVVMFFAIMVLVFGNRMRSRFAVDGRAASCEITDRTARAGNILAIVLGVLARRPGVAGAGLIGAARRSVSMAWTAVDTIACNAEKRTIALRNRWRTVLVLYCTEDNYDEVAKHVAARLAARRRTAPRRPHPVPRLLAWTAAVVLAATPVFVLPYPFELDLLVPIILVAFAVATVWLIPLFGYVIIACALYLLYEIVAIGLEERVNQFTREPYLRFEYVDSGEWVLLGAAFLGLAFLVWFSLRAVRGRTPSALAEDMAEMS